VQENSPLSETPFIFFVKWPVLTQFLHFVSAPKTVRPVIEEHVKYDEIKPWYQNELFPNKG